MRSQADRSDAPTSSVPLPQSETGAQPATSYAPVVLCLLPFVWWCRYNFLAERQTTRTHPPDDRAQPVRSVAVVGGGTTGSGIVVCFLDIG